MCYYIHQPSYPDRFRPTLIGSKLRNNALESFIGDLSPGANLELVKLDDEKNGARILISGMPPLVL